MAFYPIALLPPQFSNPSNGENASGFILQARVAGTTTLTDFYSDDSGTSVGSAITLDSGGFTAVSGNVFVPYLDDSITYKFTLTDPDTLIQFTVDDLAGTSSTQIITTVGNTTGYVFANTSTMASLTTTGSESITVYLGLKLSTLGFTTAGDGGHADYIVTNDTPNGRDIIDLGGGFSATLVLADHANCLQFGAIKTEWGTSPQPDSTDAINAALVYAEANRISCFLPGGFYFASQIDVPRGSKFFGAGAMGFGFSGPNDAMSTIQQTDGAETDLIRFIAQVTGTKKRVGSVHIHDLVLRGPNAISTAETHGIAIVDTDGTAASINSLPVFERIVLREFKGSGIYFSDQAAPMQMSSIYSFDNGRYGIEVTGGQNLRSFNGEHLYVDANRLGGIAIDAFAANQVISFNHVYCEVAKTGKRFGDHPDFAFATPYVFEFGQQVSQGNSIVHVTNASAAANQGGSGTTCDAMFKLNKTTGDEVGLIWSNCGVETQGISAGNGSMVLLDDSGDRIESGVVSGNLINSNLTKQYVKLGGDALRPYVGLEPPARGETANYIGVTGATPALVLYETDTDESIVVKASASEVDISKVDSSNVTSPIFVGDESRVEIGQISGSFLAAFSETATAGNTSLILYDVDNGAAQRVSLGPNDSAGSGFRYLRVPNP